MTGISSGDDGLPPPAETAGTPSEAIDGYLGDAPYPSSFHRQFTPQWIDAMLRHRGLAPPRTEDRAPFSLLDLGCGDGLALVGLAAAYPEGRFVGLDALPDHIERATASAAYAGLTNVAFFCGRFAEIEDPVAPTFDYVTAQGVQAWVSPENRAHVRRLAGLYLRPGGVGCIGYNTMPGWGPGLAVQQLLYLFGQSQGGSAVQRYETALAQVRGIVAVGGTPAQVDFLHWLDGLAGTLPRRYFPHEYLNRHWQPLWSWQEHAAMAEQGLAYAGTGRAELLRPDFILGPAERAALAAIADDHARETAFDIMLDQTFRIDLFGKAMAAAGDPPAARRAGWWATATTAEATDFTFVSPRRTLDFDTPAARRVLAVLADGPARMADLADAADGEGDLPDAIDALWTTGQILPCDPPADTPEAATFNRLNTAAAGAGAPLLALAGRHGLMPVSQATIVAAGAGDGVARATLSRLGIPTPAQ